jgi:hypothetical protein
VGVAAMTIGEQLRAWWVSNGGSVWPGVSEDRLLAFERRYEICIPDDMRDFFRTIDGTDGYADDFMTTFWRLEDVKPMTERWPEDPSLVEYGHFFVIADQMIEAPAFAVGLGRDRSTPNPIIRRWPWDRDSSIELVAGSFAEAITLYLTDPNGFHCL